jgi:hypothetical protein
MKIFPAPKFGRDGIDKSTIEIPINRVCSKINSSYMFANGEMFTISL